MQRERITGALVKAVTPYLQNGSPDLEAFRNYMTFIRDEGACAVLVPSVLGDSDLLEPEEKLALVKTAAETVGDTVTVIAEISGEEPAGKQASAYLSAGADALCLRYRFTDAQSYEKLTDEVISAGSRHVILTDYGPGGFDMNTGARRAAGIPADEILHLFETREAVKGVMISIPLNETGTKCSLLHEKTNGHLNIIADTATDQIPEQTDRGAEAFTTGAFVRVFSRIYTLFKEGHRDEGRQLFFDFLRVIVWTKQYVDRDPYLCQLYLHDKGIFPRIAYRRERFIDEYMERYGKEMAELAEEVEKRC